MKEAIQWDDSMGDSVGDDKPSTGKDHPTNQ